MKTKKQARKKNKKTRWRKIPMGNGAKKETIDLYHGKIVAKWGTDAPLRLETSACGLAVHLVLSQKDKIELLKVLLDAVEGDLQ